MTVSKKYFKMKHGIFSTLLISYLIVLLVSVIFLCIIYYKATSIAEKDVCERNITLLKQNAEILDNNIKDTERMFMQLFLDPKTQQFIYADKDLSISDVINANYMAKDILPTYKITNTFIFDFFIYFKNSDSIFNSSVKIAPESFFQYYKINEGITYDDWYGMILNASGKKMNFIEVPFTYYKGKKYNTINYMLHLPNDRNSLVTCVAMIDSEKVKDLLDTVNIANDGFLYIFDSDNHILSKYCANKPDDGIITQIRETEINSSGYIEKNVNNRTMVISYFKSDYSGWVYVAGIPKQEILKKVSNIKLAMIIIISVYFVLGILICMLFGYYNSKPVLEITRLITGGKGLHNVKGNEYDVIKKTLFEIMRDNKSIKDTMESQMPVLKNNFLLLLLKEYKPNQEDLDKALDFYNISIGKERCFCAVVQLSRKTNPTKMELIRDKAITINMIQQLNDYNTHLEIVEYGNNKIILVGSYDYVYKDDVWKNNFRAWVDEIKAKLGKDCGITAIIAVGGLKRSFDDIGISFSEAEESLNYIVLTGCMPVVFHDDLPGNRSMYYYPIEKESTIIELIKLSEYKSVSAMLAGIYMENFVERRLSPQMANYLLGNLKNTVIRLINELSGMNLVPDNTAEELFLKLNEDSNTEDTFNCIDGVCKSLCRNIAENRRTHADGLTQPVLDFINSHYVDYDISLTSIAEHFKLSEYHLSHFFNESIGESLPSYITKLRIKRAKELLQSDDNIGIKEIADSIGYCSERNFYRVFKKVEGITPGTYREMVIAAKKREAPACISR